MHRRTGWALVAGLVVLLLTACATPTLEQVPADRASTELLQLYETLSGARQDGSDLLAPIAYRDAMLAYDRSRRAPAAEASVLIQQARMAVDRFDEIRRRHTTLLEPVIESRQKALAVKADARLAGEFQDLDQTLRRLAQRLEENPATEAPGSTALTGDKWVQELTDGYRRLELAALKSDILDELRRAIDQARQDNVDQYAPKTLRLAEEQMLFAIAVLDRDRTRQAEARQHAADGIGQVEHARELMTQALAFEKAKASYEDMLIWHEQFVSTAFSPLLPEKVVRLPDAEKLQATLEGVMERLSRTELALREAEQREIELRRESALSLENTRQEMEQRVLAAQLEVEAERRRQQQEAERLATVRTLFAATEADVINQDGQVLIRAHGFEFASGSAEVPPGNLSLVSKILSAIELFPESRIDVSGHTDSQGDDALNQRLSEQRAAAIADLLVRVGLIPAERVRSAGFGESRPIASNETRAGRAANRRVDILINPGNRP